MAKHKSQKPHIEATEWTTSQPKPPGGAFDSIRFHIIIIIIIIIKTLFLNDKKALTFKFIQFDQRASK